MMTDPIGDLLTRLRNALRNRRPAVTIPASRIKVDIAEILRQEGYVAGYEVVPGKGPQATLRVDLRYGPDGEQIVTDLQRESKPGRRVYVAVDQIPRVMDGLGISILSTSRGLLSDREARKQRVGGELLCSVW